MKPGNTRLKTRAKGAFAGLSLLSSALSCLGTGHLNFIWDPSGASDISYHLYYGTESGGYTGMVSAGQATNAEIWGLDEGITYYFAVTTCDSLGIESDFSEEHSQSVPWSTAAGSNWLTNVQGTFNGLFQEASGARVPSAGMYSVSLRHDQAYSGHLRLGSARFSFSGRFDVQGRATNVFRRGKELALRLRVGSGDEADQISGQLIARDWAATLAGGRARYDSRTNPAPFAGGYTLVIAGRQSDPGLPAGCSYGTARVSANGVVSFAGTLADGTKATQAAAVSGLKSWPFYLPLYSGRGLLTGWPSFETQGHSDLTGGFQWIKEPAAGARYYRKGFTNGCDGFGSRYQRPVDHGATLLYPAQVLAAFSGGGLNSEFATRIELGAAGRVSDLSGSGLSMRFSLNTGLFLGKMTEPETHLPFRFSGVVLQGSNLGLGSLWGKEQTSRVVIGP